MSVFGRLFGSAAAEPIEAIGKAIDEAFTSDEERLDKQAVLEKIRSSPYLAALQISLAEAQSDDRWVKRARPFGLYIFWVTFFIQSGILPVCWWIWQTFDKTLAPPPAVLSSSDVMAVMAGILGTSFIAGRTVEKVQGRQ